ncbi:hypothetical protein [Ornithinibacillus xuwenensis]
MMQKLLGFLLLLLLGITGCSNDQPAIVKVDTPPDKVSEEPELVEEVSEDEEEVDEFIEFPLEDEVVRVNLNRVPILQAYLQAASNRQNVIETMKIERITSNDETNMYLLAFSCKNLQCSYLLLDETVENSGFLVADLASFETSSLSPDQTKLLLKFNRQSTLKLPVSDIVVIDLKNWEELSLQNTDEINDILDFQWPILGADWVNDETISISIPDILQLTTEQLEYWELHNNATNDILFQIENES